MNKVLLFSLISLLIFVPTFGALNTDLVAYWSFDEPSGNAIDSVSSYDLSVMGGTANDIVGVIGRAKNFDETIYYTIADTDDAFDLTTDFTYAFWMKMDSPMTAGSPTIFDKGANSMTTWLWKAGTPAYSFVHSKSGVADIQYTLNLALDGVWSYFSVTKSGTTYTTYINGSSVNSTVYATALGATTSNFTIGRLADNAASMYKGDIDEFGVWSRALNSTEISDLYNSGSGYNPSVTTKLDYNISLVFDNSSSHEFEFNKSVNLLFTGYNISGLVTPQSLTVVSVDLGLNENLTSNVNYGINFNNASVTNYSVLVYDPFDSSINVTAYFTINDVKNITYMNTSSFFKSNIAQSLNFSMYLNDNNITCNDYYNLTIPLLNITNRLVESCELTSVTFNNSAAYNYTAYLTNNRFGRTINNTYNFYSFNSTLNNSFNNMTNGFTSTITTTRTDTTSYPYTFTNYLLWNNTYQTVTGTNPFTTTISAVDITPLFNTSISIQSITQVTYNGETINITQNDTQYIFRLDIDDCTTFTTSFLNLIGIDELTNNPLNISFNINFEYNDEIIYNQTFSNVSSQNFCYSPGVGTYTTNAEIEYVGTPTGYTENRDYFLRHFDINEIENNVNLYCLQDNQSTLLEFTVEDDVGIGLSDYYVQFNRWSVATSSYSTISNTLTNDNGDGSTYINFFDTWYQIIISDSDGTIVKTFTKQKFTSSPVIFPVSGNVGVEYDYWSSCFSSNIYFSNSTRLVAEVTDTCGLNTALNLSVTKLEILTNTIICNTQLTGASSFTTYCDISNRTGNLYQATVNALIDDTTVQLYNEFLDYTLITDNYNGSGLFTTFIIIGVLSSIGVLVSGSVGALLGVLGLIAAYMLGFVVLTWTSILGIIVILILVLVVLKK